MAGIFWASIRILEVRRRLLWSRPLCIKASRPKIESWNHNIQCKPILQIGILLIHICLLTYPSFCSWSTSSMLCLLIGALYFSPLLFPTLINTLCWQAILNTKFSELMMDLPLCPTSIQTLWKCSSTSNSAVSKIICTSSLAILFSCFTLQLEDQLWYNMAGGPAAMII